MSFERQPLSEGGDSSVMPGSSDRSTPNTETNPVDGTFFEVTEISSDGVITTWKHLPPEDRKWAVVGKGSGS